MTTNQITIAKLIVKVSELEEVLDKLAHEIEELDKAIEENAKRAFKEDK